MLSIWTDPKFSRSLALSHKNLGSLRACSTSPLKTLWEKEEFLVSSNFSFFSTLVYTLLENLPHFSSHLNCRLQSISIWKSLKFVVRERVKASRYTALFLSHPGPILDDPCQECECATTGNITCGRKQTCPKIKCVSGTYKPTEEEPQECCQKCRCKFGGKFYKPGKNCYHI